MTAEIIIAVTGLGGGVLSYFAGARKARDARIQAFEEARDARIQALEERCDNHDTTCDEKIARAIATEESRCQKQIADAEERLRLEFRVQLAEISDVEFDE